MLASPATISALASYLSTLTADERPYLVLDPVMISTSGATLLSADDSTRTALLNELFPLVDLVTPNIPEARVLLGAEQAVGTLDDILGLAKTLHPKLGGCALLLKGGHLPVTRADVRALIKAHSLPAVWIAAEETVEIIADFRGSIGLPEESQQVVVDLLVSPEGKYTVFVGECVDTSSTHGTGCTLSAALASCYALEAKAAEGKSANGNGAAKGKKALSEAGIRRAIAYTQAAIASAPPMGRGHGPLNHGHMSAPRLIPQ